MCILSKLPSVSIIAYTEKFKSILDNLYLEVLNKFSPLQQIIWESKYILCKCYAIIILQQKIIWILMVDIQFCSFIAN